RDCLSTADHIGRCLECGSPRILRHRELFDLSIAHMDCDAFYASVEKRENPSLADKPLIIGGGRRGVVSTACYIARIRGVKSAMPMFQALKLCPDAVIVKPRMALYAEVSKEIRKMMDDLTPSVEPLSLDEAFIDLSGTQKLHGAPPAVMLVKLINRMQSELGLTGSIGLSHNKFLAKIASDLDKPRGFSVIGVQDTEKFLKDKPVRLIWGVGKAMQQSLEGSGIRTFSDLLRWERKDLNAKFGQMGDRLWHLARGQDARPVDSRAAMKSISNETTFFEDTSDLDLLHGHLWRMCEKVSSRAKAKGIAGRVLTLKLKTNAHKLITKRVTLRDATQLADTLYHSLSALLDQLEKGQSYRLLGAGLSDLCPEKEAELSPDLLNMQASQRGKAERASDAIRKKFGPDAIIKGRSLR
ncbi:MAG: DNA polymerase IV, partial [Paracoccaceae bacterium]